MGNLDINRIGELAYNNQGSLMKIIDYIDSRNVTIEFQDKYKIQFVVPYGRFKRGKVKNLYDKTVCNVGFLGEGKYMPNEVEYSIWDSMLERCYSKNRMKENPSYSECSVCEEWHNYQNFAEWYYKNIYKYKNQNLQIDKDILIKSNKVYAPDTCIFVPSLINTLFIKSNKSRGKLPIGVYKCKKKYLSNCRTIDNKTYLGSYDNPFDAFTAYKTFKEKYIKQIANEYKDGIPDKLYQALMHYKVEITD